MKKFAVFLILIAVLGGVVSKTTAENLKNDFSQNTSAVSVSKSQNDVQLSIQMDETWEASRQQKLLNLTLKNKSQSLIKVKETGESERDYAVELRDDKGDLVTFSEKGKRKTNRYRPELSVVYVKVNQGEEIVRKIDLLKLYALENGASYTVSVSKSIYIDATKKYQKIESNTIKIKI